MQSELVAKMSSADVMDVKNLDMPSSLVKYTMGMVFYLLVDRKHLSWTEVKNLITSDFLETLESFNALESLSLEKVIYMSDNYLDLYQRQKVTEQSRLCGLLYLFMLQQTKIYTTEHQIVLEKKHKEQEVQRQQHILEQSRIVIPKALLDYSISKSDLVLQSSLTSPP